MSGKLSWISYFRLVFLLVKLWQPCCKGKCNTRRCSCKSAITPMVYTELCGCTGCENVDPDEIDGIEQ